MAAAAAAPAALVVQAPVVVHDVKITTKAGTWDETRRIWRVYTKDLEVDMMDLYDERSRIVGGFGKPVEEWKPLTLYVLTYRMMCRVSITRLGILRLETGALAEVQDPEQLPSLFVSTMVSLWNNLNSSNAVTYMVAEACTHLMTNGTSVTRLRTVGFENDEEHEYYEILARLWMAPKRLTTAVVFRRAGTMCCPVMLVHACAECEVYRSVHGGTEASFRVPAHLRPFDGPLHELWRLKEDA